jgi:membrane protease YdiL (CAAX protease family)
MTGVPEATREEPVMSTAAALPRPAVITPAKPRTARAIPQLSRGQIAKVWAAAALPMGALAWIVAPQVADRIDGPGATARALIGMLAIGLVWQFVLVMFLVRREQGTLRPSVVRDALWLHKPTSPKTGRRGGRVWLVIPAFLLVVAFQEFIPSLPIPEEANALKFFESDEAKDLLAGNYAWLAIIVVQVLFNTVFGEELLFRGYLLPRMEGAFGRRDWLVNGVIFGAYHLHRPWVIPFGVLDALAYAYPAKRYRSALMGMAVHSFQSVLIIALTVSLVFA